MTTTLLKKLPAGRAKTRRVNLHCRNLYLVAIIQNGQERFVEGRDNELRTFSQTSAAAYVRGFNRLVAKLAQARAYRVTSLIYTPPVTSSVADRKAQIGGAV
ncbi:MAG: hypothetical protein K8T25_12885 [Planctomycetia bacterium]|nr:hypothetical protein [Planctomycetia bacterium]